MIVTCENLLAGGRAPAYRGTMPTGSVLAVFVFTATIVLIVPGPAVLFIVAQGVRQGPRAGLICVLGAHTGTLIQVAAAVAGLSWILLSSALAFDVVKYLGAAYLIYLGVRTLLRKPVQAEIEIAPRPAARLFTEGVLVNTLNPKLALFFLAFLPQFVDPGRGSVSTQIAVFGIVFIALGVCTDSAYALLAGVIGPWLRRSTRFLRGERLVVGGTFIGLGAVAALTPGHRSS